MYALVTLDGTACSETALCDACYSDPRYRTLARRCAYEDVMPVTFEDCTGNDALACIVCDYTEE